MKAGRSLNNHAILICHKITKNKQGLCRQIRGNRAYIDLIYKAMKDLIVMELCQRLAKATVDCLGCQRIEGRGSLTFLS